MSDSANVRFRLCGLCRVTADYLARHVGSACAIGLVAVAGCTTTGSATELGIKGTEFTINGQPTFLLGASYYGGLGASPDSIRQDLDDLQKHGFNWIRVWATWTAFTNDVSAVDSDGNAREPFLTRLKSLVSECDRRRMIVDVTLSRGDGDTGVTHIKTLAAHERAVETIVTRLTAYRNWYIDLGNERNIRDARYVSINDLHHLRNVAKRIDPACLLTASHAGGDLSSDDVRAYLFDAQLDFLTPHRPRDRGSAAETEARTQQVLEWVKSLGRSVPVHYQEPFRRGYGKWEPGAEDFSADLRGARRGGAAGWCFHNGDTRGTPTGEPRRSFDMHVRRLFDQLDPVELRFLSSLPRAGTK